MPEPERTFGGIPARRAHMRWLAAIACVVVSALPASSQSRQDEQTDAMRVLFKGLTGLVADQASANLTASALIKQAGLVEFVTPEKPAVSFMEPAPLSVPKVDLDAQALDLRLALTMLTQSYGPDGIFNVQAAQTSPNMKALVLRKGQASLADLRRLLQANQLQTTTPNGALRLAVPLIIWSGATLTLGAQDVLELDRASGTFIANFGHLDINGGTITGVGAANPASPSFQPFVTSADGGSVQVKNARISHLGFVAGVPFTGFTVMRGVVHNADRQNRIEGSQFTDLVSLGIDGANGIVLQDNRFSDMRGGSIVVASSTDATLRGNLFSGKMPTNAIRLQDGSANAVIESNVILGGKHAGILIGSDSNSVRVANNVIWKRDGGGITMNNSDCGAIVDNMVVDNTQKGIEVRDSQEAKVEHNTILSNQSAGIWVSGQAKGAQTYLTQNVLAANGSGLAGAIGESIHLSANDFTKQYPQFLSGDLTSQFKLVALDLKGTKPIVLLGSDLVADDPAKITCSN